MEDNNIRSFVTADRNIPDEQSGTSFDDTRKRLVRERVKYAGDVNKLYILGLISLVTSILSNDSISEFLGIFSSIASLVAIVCSIIIIVVHLRMSKTIEEYKSAAYCSIASIAIAILSAIIAVVSAFTFSMSGLTSTIIILLVSAVVAIYGTYKEFMGHSALLRGIDNDFSDNWNTLWGWTIFALVATFVGALIGAMLPDIGIIVVLAAGIANIVVTVIKVVYQKRMADLFVDLENECKLWDKEDKENIETIETIEE